MLVEHLASPQTIPHAVVIGSTTAVGRTTDGQVIIGVKVLTPFHDTVDGLL